MNKRQIQKQKTRELIIQTAKELFIKNGFLNTTTSQIAKTAEIAHGTLFLHFPGKYLLIEEILDMELDEISNKIYELVKENNSIEILLSRYLDMISLQEDFFSIITQEFPYYEGKLKRKILFKESVIRSHFYKVIEDQFYSQLPPKIDIATTITMLFATIKYYLIMKEYIIHKGSVIKKFKEKIITTFLAIFE